LPVFDRGDQLDVSDLQSADQTVLFRRPRRLRIGHQKYREVPSGWLSVSRRRGRLLRDDTWKVYVRALDLTTGKQVWNGSESAPAASAADCFPLPAALFFPASSTVNLSRSMQRPARIVWHFNTGQPINAQPVTYMAHGKQYVAIASGSDIFGFTLFEPEKLSGD
jgi:hypothetical protein